MTLALTLIVGLAVYFAFQLGCISGMNALTKKVDAECEKIYRDGKTYVWFQ